jgi:hypothetical protein
MFLRHFIDLYHKRANETWLKRGFMNLWLFFCLFGASPLGAGEILGECPKTPHKFTSVLRQSMQWVQTSKYGK